MAKKPTRKPAAKRGGAKKAAPQGAKTKGKKVVAKRAQARAAVRKPTAKARSSALPHRDVVELTGTAILKRQQAALPPTVEEQYRAEHADPVVPQRKRFRFRDAITGLFVKLGFAKAHPDTTVRERVE